jgi:hypothetical protein
MLLIPLRTLVMPQVPLFLEDLELGFLDLPTGSLFVRGLRFFSLGTGTGLPLGLLLKAFQTMRSVSRF